MVPGIGLVQLHVGGLNDQFAAVRHRVTRVYREIHDHLFDLALIRLDTAEVGIQRQRHLNVLAEESRKHLFHVGDQRVEVENGGGQDLLSAEC